MQYKIYPDITKDGAIFFYNVTQFPTVCPKQWLDSSCPHPRQIIAHHVHNRFELLYPVGASLGFKIEGSISCTVEEEDIIVVFPNVIHTSVVTEGNALPVQHLIQFLPSFLYPRTPLSSDFGNLLIPPKFTQKYALFKKGTPEHEIMFGLLKSIEREASEQKTGYEQALRGYFNLLYTYLIREFKQEDTDTELSSADKANINLMYKVLTYMDTHFHEPLTLQSLAKQYNISYHYFSRVFHKFTHQDFRNYLGSLRINAAKQLLLTSDDSITNIALECGFTSVSHFNQTFKSVTGITPTTFKKQYGKSGTNTD